MARARRPDLHAPLRMFGVPHLDSRLVEEIVHGEDIRRPLGLTRDYPRGGRRQIAPPAGSHAGVLRRRQGVGGPFRLAAADAAVSIGDGPEVSGTALSLLLTITGRRVALSDLDGPGVVALAAAI
ncbi:MAG TPA: hypothetical protein VFD59_09755 [Nocardioidaceae bacterium]|nr:hypothetical protein [Nocardioidaceae bacterium]